MKRKISMFAVTLCLTAAMLTGCGGNKNGTTTSPAPAASTDNATETPKNTPEASAEAEGTSKPSATEKAIDDGDNAGNAVNDIVDGVGDGVKDTVDGVEDAVDDGFFVRSDTAFDDRFEERMQGHPSALCDAEVVEEQCCGAMPCDRFSLGRKIFDDAQHIHVVGFVCVFREFGHGVAAGEYEGVVFVFMAFE